MKKRKFISTEDLRISNEILKMQLQAEFGMTFHTPDQNSIPPEIERSWLKSIQRFEKANAAGIYINCYSAIGKPDFAPEAALNDHALSFELKRLLILLQENNIVVDEISKITDREKYKFITEILFFEEIIHMPDSKMILHFTFSEYFPEDENLN